MGYSDENIGKLCKEYLAKGFTAFKLKVGRNLEEDRKRCRLIRDEIGYTNKLVNARLPHSYSDTCIAIAINFGTFR